MILKIGSYFMRICNVSKSIDLFNTVWDNKKKMDKNLLALTIHLYLFIPNRKNNATTI